MTDDEIVAALLAARAQGGMQPFSVSNAYVIDRARVEGDHDAVERWLLRQGGELVEWPGVSSGALTPGWQRPPSRPPSYWYVVPSVAIAP